MDESPSIISGASKNKRRFPWTWIILAAVLSVPLIFIGSFAAMPFIAIYQADEGFKKAKKTIDPEQLRTWALETIKSSLATNDYPQSIPYVPESKIPDYIENLFSTHPKVLVNPKTSEEDATVLIMWGGGSFGWQIQVGKTNFSMPFNSHNGEYTYNFEWVKGIYYTREASWGLW